MLVDLSIQPNYFGLLVWSLNCVERITGSITNYSCFSIQHRRFGDQWKRASAPNSLQQIQLVSVRCKHDHLCRCYLRMAA
jgi:hypothetical protein